MAEDDDAVQGFVVLEQYQLRVQALCRPAAFAEQWQIAGNELDAAEKERLKALALAEVTEKISVEGLEFDQRHAQFIKLTEELGYQPDERDVIPLEEAVLGVSLSSPTQDLTEVNLNWLWRGPAQTQMPLKFSAGEHHSGRNLTADAPSFRWVRDSKLDLEKELTSIPPIEFEKRKRIPDLIILPTLIIGLLLRLMKKVPIFALLLLSLGTLMVGFNFSHKHPATQLPDQPTTEDIVDGLLHNTYHAFDRRDVEDIYTVLESSIEEGPLLERVYLEIRQGLELEGQGGPRVSISTVALQNCEITASDTKAGSFDVQAQWATVGDVNHWGHTHLRTNRYKADLQVSAIDGEWKFSHMQVLDEQRTQKVSQSPQQSSE